jgi:hypothetical protein
MECYGGDKVGLGHVQVGLMGLMYRTVSEFVPWIKKKISFTWNNANSKRILNLKTHLIGYRTRDPPVCSIVS